MAHSGDPELFGGNRSLVGHISGRSSPDASNFTLKTGLAADTRLA